MPSCLGKSSYKEGQVVQRKTHRESFIETIQRKFNSRLEGKKTGKSAKLGKDSIDTCSEKGSSLSDTALPSSRVSHCHCFAEQTYAQPLPLPVPHPPGVGHAGSGLSPTILELHGFSKPLSNSDLLPGYGCDLEHQLSRDAWGDLVTASVSRNSSTDTNDHPDSQLLSPQASDYESGNVTAINSPSSYMDYSSIIMRRILEDHLKSAHLPISKIPFTSTKDGPFGAQVTKLQITPRAGSFSAPHSYISSPARSPGNASAYEQVVKCGSDVGTPGLDVNLFGSGHCCNLGSEKISEHNPVSDRSFIRPQSECSPEYSPVPSPRITSHVQSESVASLHPGRSFTESPMDRSDDGKSKSHKLPLPPATACNSFPFSFSKEAVKTPTPPRNHCRPVISTSPVPRWKKGRLIGSGTFGQVYMGFNSETGEMCAMKEVALFSDDSKSKESAQQLRKEITLLSRLKHPNIVEYFDSEMVDNKLHIYLEYVSGGSIYKILREYGELGESAIRSYARQILSGLAYLHSKNTAHRDIKGANILVDPSGQVKLADFGMAKQITGESCLLSFKGSPYWMAPEVIKNSNGCSFAVDIWSLGCTVIEMATTKPPWSQYEGVAALFKIGNSKELPAAPDHLSKEGKDFVLECLQRNPRDRPTAVQLLGHPFVRNAASPERCLINQDPPGSYYIAINAKTYKGMGHAKTISSLDLEGVGVQSSRGLQTGSGSSSPHMSEHTSCPVSPIGSPLLHPKSSQPRYSRRYPTISSPQTACGSSTPCSSGKVAFPVHHLDHSMPYPHEVTGAGRPQRNLYANGSPLYCKRMLETVSGIPEVIR